MPNIGNPGSLFYPSGNETATQLASGATVTLTSADVNILRTYFASGPGANIQMPNVASNAYASGRSHFVGFLHQDSFPIGIRNGGVVGYEATLEKYFPPGYRFQMTLMQNTSGSMYGQPYSSGAGMWAMNSQYEYWNQTDLRGAVRLNFGIADKSVTLSNGYCTSGTLISSCSNIAVLDVGTPGAPTLGVYVYTDNANNVKGIPLQASADGLTQSVGVETQIAANGGNLLIQPFVSRCTSGTALVCYWDSTNSQNNFTVVTITSGSPPTLSVGSTANDTSLASGLRIQQPGNRGSDLTPNGNTGPNQWLVGYTGATNSNRNRAYYITVSGTVPTFSASLDYNPSVSQAFTNIGYKPFSPANNVLLTLGNISGVNPSGQLCFLGFNGSAITSGTPITFTGNQYATQNVVYRIDPYCQEAGQYLIWIATANNAYITTINLATSGLIYRNFGFTPGGFNTPSITVQVGEGEWFSWEGNNYQPTYFDYRKYFLAGNATPMPSTQIQFPNTGIRGIAQGMGVNQTNRRLITVQNNDPTSTTGTLFFTMCEFPKR